MASLSAEIYFKKGLAALVAQNFEDASKLFRQALDLERDRGARHPDMRYLSYYGLSLARAGHSTSTAIQACRTAAMKQRGDPVLYLNLGRVYLLARRIGPAAAAFEQGLAVAPDHTDLLATDLEIDAAHRLEHPLLGGEAHVQSLDFHQRFAHRECLGSSTSRRPSPSRLKPRLTTKMARPGTVATHQ